MGAPSLPHMVSVGKTEAAELTLTGSKHSQQVFARLVAAEPEQPLADLGDRFLVRQCGRRPGIGGT